MNPFDAEAPAGAAAPGDPSPDDEIVEGELLDAGGDAPAGATEQDAAAAAGIPELSEVERLVAERDEYLDALRRLQADSENFRKRVRRQEEERSSRGVESLVERLLPVLDATDLAAEHAGDEKDATAFAQVASLLWDVLAREGLERVSEAGVGFDPNVHDAVAHVPADPVEVGDAGDAGEESEAGKADTAAAGPPGLVVDAVLRPGFLLRGKVLRPAMVRVKG
jgi:molecular chaperone GrpE